MLKAMKQKEAAKKVEDRVEETLTYCDFPYEHWTRIRTNNSLQTYLRITLDSTSIPQLALMVHATGPKRGFSHNKSCLLSSCAHKAYGIQL